MDGCPTVDGQEPQDLACPRLDPVQRDSLPSEIEGEPAERPDPDARPRPRPERTVRDRRSIHRRGREHVGTRQLGQGLIRLQPAPEGERRDEPGLLVDRVEQQPVLGGTRLVHGRRALRTRAGDRPACPSRAPCSRPRARLLAPRAHPCPRAHRRRARAPTPRRPRHPTVGRSRPLAPRRARVPLPDSEPAHAVTSARIAAAHGSSTSDGAGSRRGAPGSSSPRIRASRASHASPARSACSPASWSTTTPVGVPPRTSAVPSATRATSAVHADDDDSPTAASRSRRASATSPATSSRSPRASACGASAWRPSSRTAASGSRTSA